MSPCIFSAAQLTSSVSHSESKGHIPTCILPHKLFPDQKLQFMILQDPSAANCPYSADETQA